MHHEVVTLTIAFSLPLPLEGSVVGPDQKPKAGELDIQGQDVKSDATEVTIIPPAIAGQLAYHAAAGTEARSVFKLEYFFDFGNSTSILQF